MKTKKAGSAFIWIFAAVALFLAVPFITSEEASSGNNGGLSIENEGSLPVIGSENPLAKYFNKVAEFYGFKKKSPKRGGRASAAPADGAEEGALGSELGDILASVRKDGSAQAYKEGSAPDDLEAVRSAYAKASAVSVENGAVKTKSGLIVKPSKDGYELNGVFYKNGTYPSLSVRREIENALSKFHRENAARQGLTAAYFRGPDGGLSVRYVSPESLPGGGDRSLFASADGAVPDYYRGAKIVSRNNSSGGASGSSARRGRNVSMDNIEDAYNSVSSQIKDVLDSSGSSAASSEDKSDDDETQNLSKELIANANNVSARMVFRNKRSDEQPNAIPPEYEDAPGAVLVFSKTPIGSSSMADFLNKYGIEGGVDFKEISISLTKNHAHNQAVTQNAVRQIEALKLQNEDGLVKLFSPAPLPDRRFDFSTSDKGIYLAYPRTPYMEVGENGQAKEDSFSEVFYERTGISRMIEAMSNSDSEESLDTSALEARYAALDQKRAENNKYLHMIGSNEAISKRMPKMVFFLGKTRRNPNNVMVASPSSFLYVYAPGMAPDFVAAGSSEDSYQEMTSAEFLSRVGAKGNNNIVVVNNEKVRDTLIKAGVKNVSVIDEERLSSGVPEDIEYVIDSLREVVTERVMSDDALKREFLKALSETDKKAAGK